MTKIEYYYYLYEKYNECLEKTHSFSSCDIEDVEKINVNGTDLYLLLDYEGLAIFDKNNKYYGSYCYCCHDKDFDGDYAIGNLQKWLKKHNVEFENKNLEA